MQQFIPWDYIIKWRCSCFSGTERMNLIDWLTKTSETINKAHVIPCTAWLFASFVTNMSFLVNSAKLWLPFLYEKLYLSVPVNKTGSCGMMARRDLRVDKSTLVMSSPSMRMVPSVISSIRKNASVAEVLPLPVLPQIPIWGEKISLLVMEKSK